MAKFSDRLRLLRNENGLSQLELAKQLGCVSKSSVNMYERGEREPSLETLEVIADYFNVDMDYLLGKTETPNRYKELMASLHDEINSGREAAKDKMFAAYGAEHSTSSLQLMGDKVALLYYRARDRRWAAAMSEIVASLEALEAGELEHMVLTIRAYTEASKPIQDIVDTALRPYVDEELKKWVE